MHHIIKIWFGEVKTVDDLMHSQIVNVTKFYEYSVAASILACLKQSKASENISLSPHQIISGAYNNDDHHHHHNNNNNNNNSIKTTKNINHKIN